MEERNEELRMKNERWEIGVGLLFFLLFYKKIVGAKNQKESVAGNSILASFFMTGMKLTVGLMTGSLGILSEAAHSLLDMGAAIITYFAVRASDKPADKEHPYGHGKIESISALAETVLLFITSIWIIYEAVSRLLHGGVEIEVTWYAVAVVVISIGIDYSRSKALLRVARETKSQALEADALHFRSDIWSSTVVLIGLLCVAFGYPGADAIAALGVALFVIKVGYDMGKRTFDVLIDTAPVGVEEAVREILLHTPDIMRVDRVRVRTMGATVSIDTVISIDRKYRGDRVRGILSEAELSIHKQFSDADVLIHVKPVMHPEETFTEKIHLLAEKDNLFVHNVIVDTQGGKMFVSYDLEIPAENTLLSAHDIASRFEEKIRNVVGKEAEINTHLDPIYPDVVKSGPISEETLREIKELILVAGKQIPNVHALRNIRVRRVARKLLVTVHCSDRKEMSLDEAHGYSEELEHRILESSKKIGRVIVHVEPE